MFALIGIEFGGPVLAALAGIAPGLPEQSALPLKIRPAITASFELPTALTANSQLSDAMLAARSSPTTHVSQALIVLQATPPLPPSANVNEVRRASDGLFYVDAQVNGATVRFIVDTGATTTVLTQIDAARAGVGLTPSQLQETANTAGGKTAMARVTLANMMVAGSFERQVPAAVTGAGLTTSLLGQDWLSHLTSVTIRGDRMVLE